MAELGRSRRGRKPRFGTIASETSVARLGRISVHCWVEAPPLRLPLPINRRRQEDVVGVYGNPRPSDEARIKLATRTRPPGSKAPEERARRRNERVGLRERSEAALGDRVRLASSMRASVGGGRVPIAADDILSSSAVMGRGGRSPNPQLWTVEGSQLTCDVSRGQQTMDRPASQLATHSSRGHRPSLAGFSPRRSSTRRSAPVERRGPDR